MCRRVDGSTIGWTEKCKSVYNRLESLISSWTTNKIEDFSLLQHLLLLAHPFICMAKTAFAPRICSGMHCTQRPITYVEQSPVQPYHPDTTINYTLHYQCSAQFSFHCAHPGQWGMKNTFYPHKKPQWHHIFLLRLPLIFHPLHLN